MIPFVLGAVVGGIAVTALGDSKIGKKISKEGTRLIDTLDDRITALDEKHEICKTLKCGYENVSTRLNTFIKTTGEKLSNSIEEGKEYFASVTEYKEANPVKETENSKKAAKDAVDKKEIVKKSTAPKRPQPKKK